MLGTAERVTLTRRFGGPNPLDLMIGSEGTLGIIASARLRLHPAPQTRAFAAFRLPSFDAGAEAMRVIMQAGLRPAVLRLYDPLDSYLLSRGKVADERGRVLGLAHGAQHRHVHGQRQACHAAPLQATRALTGRPWLAQGPPAVLKPVVEGIDEIHAPT